jgi:phosphoinositide-3-kinase regulatory subunit 4
VSFAIQYDQGLSLSGARVRHLSAAPLLQSKPSWVTCSVDGNNEVSVWNLETGACEKSLWASHAPPLSQTQVRGRCQSRLLLINR